MRQFDLTTGPPILLVAGMNFVTVQGPSYKMTAQSQILRLLYASSRLASLAVNDVGVYEAFLQVVLNPNKGADRIWTCPLKESSSMLSSNLIGQPFLYIGGSQTFGYDVGNVDVRGDDIPIYGGIEFVPGGGSDFSVTLLFVYQMLAAVGGELFSPSFSVLADLSDYSELPLKR